MYQDYSDFIMGVVTSPITSLTIVYSTVYSGADQRKHQSSASLAICAGNSPVTGEFPAQMTSNVENVSIWWRHHEIIAIVLLVQWKTVVFKILINSEPQNWSIALHFTSKICESQSSNFTHLHLNFDILTNSAMHITCSSVSSIVTSSAYRWGR